MAQTEVVAYFENRPKLNKNKTEEAGRPIYDDRDVCIIRIPGDTNRVVVQPADQRWKTENGVAITFAQRFPEQFARYKAGEAQTQAGTPLSEAPFLTEAKRKELKALSIYTVETLAALEGNQLKALSIGGRDLKAKAQAYLDAAAGGANNEAMMRELEALRAEVAAMKSGSAPVDGAAIDEALAAADGNFVKFRSLAKKALGDNTPAKKPDIVAALNAARGTTSPFDEYEDDDIRAWLTEAGVDASKMDRAALIAKADEVNAQMAKAA